MNNNINELNKKATNDIPKLHNFGIKLKNLVEEMLQIKVRHKNNNYFAFMSNFFLRKQLEHLKSVLILADNHQGRDAGLIVRSMLEGLIQLIWANNDRQKHALQWWAFGYVLDWRERKKKLIRGENIDKKISKDIDMGITEYGYLLLTKKAKNYKKVKKALPSDPYFKNNWTGKSYTQLFNEVKGEILFEKLYRPFSAWNHWSPESLIPSVNFIDNKITYFYPDPVIFATAFAVSFQCLIGVAKLTNSHLKLGFANRISKLIKEYINQINITNY